MSQTECWWPNTVHAGFEPRFKAYLIDVLPILFIAYAIACLFFGFDEQLKSYLAHPRGYEEKIDFRNFNFLINVAVTAVWIIYSATMESSSWQATIGKRLIGIRVVDQNCERITVGQAVVRNVSKLLSSAVYCIGYIWIIYSAKKQGWHDLIAHTYVVMPVE